MKFILLQLKTGVGMYIDSVQEFFLQEKLFAMVALGLCLFVGYKIQGLGDGITVPSLPSWKWIVGIALVMIMVGLAFVYRSWSKRPKTTVLSEKKSETKVPATKDKGGEKEKKKKDESYHFFPFWMLMTFHWVGMLTLYGVCVYIASQLLPVGPSGKPEVGAQVWVYAILAFPFYLNWANLVNGPKGPRPLAFAIGWVVTIVGMLTTGLLVYMIYTNNVSVLQFFFV